MNMNEEWFGIVGIDPVLVDGVDKRILRKAYYVIREFWKNPHDAKKVKKATKSPDTRVKTDDGK